MTNALEATNDDVTMITMMMMMLMMM